MITVDEYRAKRGLPSNSDKTNKETKKK